MVKYHENHLNNKRIFLLGNEKLLQKKKIGVFISRTIPLNIIVPAEGFLLSLSELFYVFMSGWHSSFERRILKKLLLAGKESIFFTSKGIKNQSLYNYFTKPINEKRLLMGSFDLPPKNWSRYNVRVRIKERGERMARRSYRPEQIIKKLREAEVLLSQGSTIGETARKLGVTEQTYYRWRKEYGGMKIERVKRLKELEKENTRLKRLVADLSLDNAILKEAARGNS